MRTAFLLFLLLGSVIASAQPCTTLGQTPSTAFPVCGTTVFQQNNVPFCSSNNLYVPGCSGSSGADYENRNPFFYKFTCYVGGTLGFVITPNVPDEDYDWQLYDITNRNPNDIFTVNSLVVTGNWAGTYGPTGTSATGVAGGIQCASDPASNEPTFAAMPTLIAGHEYLLLISHYTNTNFGYALSFGGGTGVITDPAIPHMTTVKPSCDGLNLSVKLNKRVRCNSLTNTGSEFRLSTGPTVVNATTVSCSAGFDTDSIILTLSAPLTNGNYQLIIDDGSDANTLLDLCGNGIPRMEAVSFLYAIPQPIFADSIAKFGCAPDSLKLYFPKKIACNSISPDGSDFAITGPSTVTVTSAGGYCVDGKSDFVTIRLASPISVKGNYQLRLKAGNDGSVVIDECGQETPLQTMPFVAFDTVSAAYTYTVTPGCQANVVRFLHDGRNDVNQWNWTFNGNVRVQTQSHTISWPSTSNNTIRLVVSNGVCMDSVDNTMDFANEVKASFTTSDIICPEDQLELKNTSTGIIDGWEWSYDGIAIGTVKEPAPFTFPNNNNQELYRTIKLVAYNNLLNCRDSARKTVVVLDNCFIAVPTAFTPNNDGLNDDFSPNNALKADNFDFKVFNRWGQLVFHSRDWRKKWDGKINGVPQGTGVFAWVLSYTHRETKKQVLQKGTVALIR